MISIKLLIGVHFGEDTNESRQTLYIYGLVFWIRIIFLETGKAALKINFEKFCTGPNNYLKDYEVLPFILGNKSVGLCANKFFFRPLNENKNPF